MRIILLLLIFLLGCAQPAEGKPRREVKFINVRLFLTDAVCAQHAYDSYQRARAAIRRQAQIRLRLREITFIEDPHHPWTVEECINRRSLHYFLNTVGTKRGYTTIVATGNLEGNYFAGWASGVCVPKRGFILIHAKLGNTEAALNKTSLVYKHEMGHAGLGMEHFNGEREDGSCWIMHENAGSCVGGIPDPLYHISSLKAKNRCLNTGKGKNKKLKKAVIMTPLIGY